MKNLIAIPVILLAVLLESSVVSRVKLLSGTADLPLVMLAAWSLQDQVETAWHWAIAAGLLVGFISGMPWFVPMIGYLIIVLLARGLQRRVWQAPLLAMFLVTFLGTLVTNLASVLTLRLLGMTPSLADVFGLIVLPSVLLNLLLAIPVYAVMRDFASWVHPLKEAV
jgi:rod shape-determining protein MreD